MIHGHSSTNSGTQASEDNSELAAQRRCHGDLELRGKSFRGLEARGLVTFTVVNK